MTQADALRRLRILEPCLRALGASSLYLFGSTPRVTPPRTAKLALVHAFSILSEASWHIPEGLKQQEPDVPRRDTAGMGNVLRHDYQRVSYEILGNAAARHLTGLREALLRLRKREMRDGRDKAD